MPKSVHQLHSSEYQKPAQLNEGNVLVVGGGNSGSQIAVELAGTRNISISASHRIFFLPRVIWNRSFIWWLDVFGLSRLSVNSRLAKYIQIAEPVVGLELKRLIKKRVVDVKKRTMRFRGSKAVFENGTNLPVSNVIWATGFSYDYSWINIRGVTDRKNKPIHRQGVSQAQGLYFLGLSWLSTMSSAQINGISADAEFIIKHITKSFSLINSLNSEYGTRKPI